jgi:DNA replication protein DnaC
MTSSEKQSSPASTTTCSKHGVPLAPVEMGGGALPVHTLYYCPKCDEENEAEAAARAAEERRARLLSGIPPRYHDADLRQFDAALIAPIIKWAANPAGFLFVNGPVGTGKTHAACAVKKRLNYDSRYSSLVFSMDMFQELHKSFGKRTDTEEDAVIRRYAPESSKSIVIFDDVGAQKVSEYTTEAWFKIIDRRYRHNAPTMFTTNLTFKELAANVGDRTASRIASGVRITFDGDDRRIKMNPSWTTKFD